MPPVSPMGKDDVVNQKTKNIRLYVKRVFISDDFDGELVREASLGVVFQVTCLSIFVLIK